jgi:NADPH-dependent 2,4-dienoyl-CoA reductase/sulfur reductase-like enzyme
VGLPIVVVGASAAGLGAAQGLRSRGYDGDLVVVDPDRDLPYERPTLSKAALRDLDGSAPGPGGHDRLADLAVERVSDVAVGLDVAGRRIRLAGGRELPYRTVVLASGALPRRPASLDRPSVHVLRTLADATGLRAALTGAASVVVVGAGFLGTEVAAAAATAGRRVTVIDPLPLPLGPLGGLVSERVAALHRSHGVELLLGCSVSEVLDGPVHGVRLADGRTVPGDVVLLALGVVPADTWLSGAGLTLADGVVVDEHLQAAPGVLAAGDVARVRFPRYGEHLRVEHWTTALTDGDRAAAVALDGPAAAPAQEPPYVWTEQYDVRICILGRTAGRMATVVEQHPTADRFVVAYTDPAGRVDGVLTWNWTRMLAPWRARVAAGTPLMDGG